MAMLHLSLMLSVLACVLATPEVMTSNGNVHIVVDGADTVFAVRRRVNGVLGDPTNVITQDMVDQLINDRLQALTDRLTLAENTIAALTTDKANATLADDVADVTQRLSTAEGTITSQGQSISGLQTDKADIADVVSLADVSDQVEDMLKPSAPANDLKLALNNKLDVSAKYTDADVTTLVTSLVNGANTNNVLYTTLQDVQSRVETLEDAVDGDCGSHCRAGQFVSQACTETASTTCSDCQDGFFSLGGLPSTCTQCTVCPDGFYVVSSCTKTSDTVCSRCTECEEGVSYETTACQGNQNRVCDTCDGCSSTQYASTVCNITANDVCVDCTTCTGDFEVATSCGETADAVCRYRAVGFRAVMSAGLTRTATGNGDITNWITSRPNVINSLFSTVGNAFDGTTFTVPEDGFYFSAINMRFDAINSRYIRTMATLDNVYSDNEGLHVMKGDINANYYTLSTAGVLKLDRNAKIKASFYSDTDRAFNIWRESGFSVMKVPVTEGVMAEQKTGGQRVRNQAAAFVTATNYDNNAKGAFLQGGTFVNGVYTTKQAGVYILSATQRIDSATGRYMRLLIALNGSSSIQNGLHSITGQPFSPNFMSLHVSGVAYMEAGDTARVQVFNIEDTDYTLQEESFFSAARIETTSAFNADLNVDRAIRGTGWVDVVGWRVTGVRGLFNLGGNFNPSTGRYRAPVDGYYLVSANIRLDLTAGSYFRCNIRCSGDSASISEIYNNGLMSIRGLVSRQAQYQHLNPSGVMYVRRGQEIWVSIFNQDDVNGYTIQQESGFSVTLLTSATPPPSNA